MNQQKTPLHHGCINQTNETVSLDNSISRNLLHEICHLLINGWDNNVDFDINGETLVDTSTIGVRDTIWRENPDFSGGFEPDMYNRIQFACLLDQDINFIQYLSEARD